MQYIEEWLINYKKLWGLIWEKSSSSKLKAYQRERDRRDTERKRERACELWRETQNPRDRGRRRWIARLIYRTLSRRRSECSITTLTMFFAPAPTTGFRISSAPLMPGRSVVFSFPLFPVLFMLIDLDLNGFVFDFGKNPCLVCFVENPCGLFFCFCDLGLGFDVFCAGIFVKWNEIAWLCLIMIWLFSLVRTLGSMEIGF